MARVVDVATLVVDRAAFTARDGRAYLPDFYVPSIETYVEVKGWWRDDARAKFDAFLRMYPTLNCALIMRHDRGTGGDA